MIQIGLAVILALAAWSVTAALGLTALRRQRLYAWLLAGAGVALAGALTAALMAAVLGFSPLTFRIFQTGVGLLGPLGVAWAAVELVARSVRGRFAFRNLVAVLLVLPLVALVFDPVTGTLSESYPPFGEHYGLAAQLALTVVHVVAVLAALGMMGIAVRRGSLRAAQSSGQPLAVGLLALAVLGFVLVAHYGLGAFGQLLVGIALGCVVAGAVFAPDDPAETADDWGDDEDGDFFDEEWADPAAAGTEKEPVSAREGRRRRRREPDRPDEPANAGDTGSASSSGSARVKGVITIYTLHEGRESAFDRLAWEVIERVSKEEPDTLLYTCHTVSSAPQQRIIYAIYRDELAREEHGQKSHNLEFYRLVAQHVFATNIIELGLLRGKAEERLHSMLATGR